MFSNIQRVVSIFCIKCKTPEKIIYFLINETRYFCTKKSEIVHQQLTHQKKIKIFVKLYVAHLEFLFICLRSVYKNKL